MEEDTGRRYAEYVGTDRSADVAVKKERNRFSEPAPRAIVKAQILQGTDRKITLSVRVVDCQNNESADPYESFNID